MKFVSSHLGYRPLPIGYPAQLSIVITQPTFPPQRGT